MLMRLHARYPSHETVAAVATGMRLGGRSWTAQEVARRVIRRKRPGSAPA